MTLTCTQIGVGRLEAEWKREMLTVCDLTKGTAYRSANSLEFSYKKLRNMPIARNEMTSMPTVWPVGTEPMFSEEKEDASSGAMGAGQKPCPSHRKRGKRGNQQRAARKGRGPGIWNQCQLRVYHVDPRISHTTVKIDVFFQSSSCICCNMGQRDEVTQAMPEAVSPL